MKAVIYYEGPSEREMINQLLYKSSQVIIRTEDYKEFLDDTIKNALEVSDPNIHIFYWCDQTYIGLIQELYRELGSALQRQNLVMVQFRRDNSFSL